MQRWLLAALVLGMASATVLFATAALLISAEAAQAVVTLSVGTGKPDTPVTISGTGFPPGEIVALYIDAPNPYLDVPGPRSDAQGSFSKSVKWPTKAYDRSGHVDPTKPGPHQVCGDTGYPGSSQPIAVKACAQFLVQASASPSPGQNPAAPSGGVPVPVVLGAIVVLLGLAGAAWLSMRGPK